MTEVWEGFPFLAQSPPGGSLRTGCAWDLSGPLDVANWGSRPRVDPDTQTGSVKGALLSPVT